MRAVVERVEQAEVSVEGSVVGRIGPGLLVYLAVGHDDGADDVAYIADKVRGLRIFNDSAGKMNLSVVEIGGQVLLISAFALQGDARKGRRPSFAAAAPPEHADRLYQEVGRVLEQSGLTVARGVFRAHMHVRSVNDGPICILLDSKRGF